VKGLQTGGHCHNVTLTCIKRMPLDFEPYQLSFRRLSRDRATLADSKAPSAAITDP
jgi:hypothetical protein